MTAAEDVVRRAVAAFLARDVEGILALSDARVEVRSLLTEAERATYLGHEGVRDWFRAVFGVFPDWHPEPRDTEYAEGDAVVIPLHVTATAAGSGVPIDQIYWLGARTQAAKITFFGFFRTCEDARDAVT